MQADSKRNELRQCIKDALANREARAAVQLARDLLAVSSKASDVLFCATCFAAESETLTRQAGLKRLRTYLVRSVTLEPVLPYLSTEAVFSGFFLDLQAGGYGSYVSELLQPDSELARFQPDLVLIALDLEEVAGRLPALCADGLGAGVEGEIQEAAARMEQLLRNFRSRSSARMLLHGLLIPDLTSSGDVGDANLPHSLTNAVLRLNQRLAEVCRATPDCVFFDVDRLAARHGRARWRDKRMFLASRLPLSAEFFLAYARGLVRSFATLFRAPRKVLCTDLDNTLWGGILGEDGADGIATGSAFPGNCYLEYQRYLKQLSQRGILLAVVSKNNEIDVLEAFQTRAADLALSLDDFVARKIGWGEKADALRELSQELSLGLDSFVFVDDNPAECAAMQSQLPEVAVLQAPAAEPWKLVDLVAEQPYFDAILVTDDDVNRLQEYKAQTQRMELARSTGSREEFLASMEIVCTFQSALQAPLSRAVQLLAKTNQFNLTTRRRSAAVVEQFLSAPGGQAVVVRVRDRFGDAGVVGLALAGNRGDVCYIDSLLLSCRVIGRGIETALLAWVAEQAVRTGARRLVGEFIATKKNAPCATFYADHGFVRCAAPEAASAEAAAADATFYEFDLTAARLSSPEWITLEGTEQHELSPSTALTA